MKKITLLFAILSTLFTYAGNKDWSVINEQGQTVFNFKALSVYDYQSGLARVYRNTLVNNKWVTGYGFIDKQGNIVIDCNLKEAQDFQGDRTWVKFEGNDFFTFIDKKGNVIPTKKYSKVGRSYSFQTDIFAVYENGKMGFINESGKEIIPCKYSGTEVFTEGLASVSLYDSEEGLYGFIDKEGNEVIPLKFKQSGVSSFENGLARASVRGKTVLIDHSGEIKFSTSKGNVQGYSFNLVSVFNKPLRTGWGWLNTNDEFVIQPIYDHARDFNSKGYAIVEENGLKGMIDTTGKVVIDFKFETIYNDIDEDGFYLVVYPSKEPTSLSNAKKDFLNANFEKLELPGVNYIYGADNQKLMVFEGDNGLKGYLNREYQIVVPAKYYKADGFNEGLAWVRFNK